MTIKVHLLWTLLFLILQLKRRKQKFAYSFNMECRKIRNIDLVALIHDSEDDAQQFKVAASMISKVAVYSDTVNTTNELTTSKLLPIKGRENIEAIPFTGRGANTLRALEHFNDNLKGEDKLLVAFLLTNEMLDYNEEVEKLAQELRARGVMIFVFTIPQKNRALTWVRENLVKVAGNEDFVYNLLSLRSTEIFRGRVTTQIMDMATKKGCDRST